MKKVLYEELLPEECVQRITGDAGCLSPAWHIGMAWSTYASWADGIQSKELFVRVAEKVGGVVLPMLFMGT